MTKKKQRAKQFTDLTWTDLEDWAGGKIFSRGKNYQREGRVSDLAVTDDGGLIAWVDGTDRYATKVVMDEDGLPDSICTCPYCLDCKHGVAVVLEYLKHIENNQPVPENDQDDERLELLENEGWDDEPDEDEISVSEDIRHDIDDFLKGKTKAQLIDLIHEFAGQYPEMAMDLSDRKQMLSGNAKTLVTRLSKEIRDISEEPGWQNHWNNEGYTPDYSGVRKKLRTLLNAGHADDVLALGWELVTTGNRQVEESNDEGETEMEIADCMPVILEALEQSSLDVTDKLSWALDAVLEDQFEICEVFEGYLDRRHPQNAWNDLADQLLGRLKKLKISKSADNFTQKHARDRLSNWAIHALEKAGRKEEIIPLCEAEACKTWSYERLVKRLVAARRYKDAEHWIQKGIEATKEKCSGTASGLRDTLREIRTRQKNWPAVAAMRAEDFVRYPSRQSFMECKKACGRLKAWPSVREYLLCYLEKGELPWKKNDWPLPESGLEAPTKGIKDRFPLINDLIKIAILEKRPELVLYWYDKGSKDRFGWLGTDVDAIATAVQAYAPDRAVGMWKRKAERLIAQVKPSAYREAVRYLRKAAKVMSRENKQEEWEKYIKVLRQAHARKRRLMENLDGLEKLPV